MGGQAVWKSPQGHINTMMDSDGILRHHLLYFDRPNGTRVPSMALAQRYQDGLELPPVSARGFWYKAPGGFETRSITDVLEREDPAAYFAGKIVHIGLCAAGLQDSYVMAIDHARQMYGVEYQANAVQAMLEGSYKREIGTAPQLAGIRGVTAMSESLEPERVVEILSQYLTLIIRCVMDDHGTLDKFVGDCTMDFWNAPYLRRTMSCWPPAPWLMRWTGGSRPHRYRSRSGSRADTGDPRG